MPDFFLVALHVLSLLRLCVFLNRIPLIRFSVRPSSALSLLLTHPPYPIFLQHYRIRKLPSVATSSLRICWLSRHALWLRRIATIKAMGANPIVFLVVLFTDCATRNVVAPTWSQAREAHANKIMGSNPSLPLELPHEPHRPSDLFGSAALQSKLWVRTPLSF